MPHVPASDALSHVTVLDVTRVRSGPTAVRQLADWGANVIKIEPPASVEADGALGAARATPDFQNLFLRTLAIENTTFARFRIIKRNPFFHENTNIWFFSVSSRVVSKSPLTVIFPPLTGFSMTHTIIRKV